MRARTTIREGGRDGGEEVPWSALVLEARGVMVGPRRVRGRGGARASDHGADGLNRNIRSWALRTTSDGAFHGEGGSVILAMVAQKGPGGRGKEGAIRSFEELIRYESGLRC